MSKRSFIEHQFFPDGDIYEIDIIKDISIKPNLDFY